MRKHAFACPNTQHLSQYYFAHFHNRLNINSSLGVDFIKDFAPYAHLLRPAPIFCVSKKLLKSWAQGAKAGRRGLKPFMKSTLDYNIYGFLYSIFVQRRILFHILLSICDAIVCQKLYKRE